MNARINLQDITDLLVEKSGITKEEAALFLNEWFDTIVDALLEDQIVKIKNLGSLKLSIVSDRESIDVATGNRVLIPAHYKINFIPDNTLAQAVNEPFAFFETVELDTDQVIENTKEENIETEEVATEVKEDLPEELKAERVEEIQIDEKNILNEEREDEERPFLRRKRRRWWRKKLPSSILYAAILLIVIGAFIYLQLADKDDPMLNEIPYTEQYIPNDSDPIPFRIDSILQDSLKIRQQKNVPDTLPKQENSQGEVKTRTIRAGERLTLIAEAEYGHKAFWIYLYEENKTVMENPNAIPAGLIIKIPPAEKYGIDKNNPESIRKAKELTAKEARMWD
jgi:nucleoid DNA-binding protein